MPTCFTGCLSVLGLVRRLQVSAFFALFRISAPEQPQETVEFKEQVSDDLGVRWVLVYAFRGDCAYVFHASLHSFAPIPEFTPPRMQPMRRKGVSPARSIIANWGVGRLIVADWGARCFTGVSCVLPTYVVTSRQGAVFRSRSSLQILMVSPRNAAAMQSSLRKKSSGNSALAGRLFGSGIDVHRMWRMVGWSRVFVVVIPRLVVDRWFRGS